MLRIQVVGASEVVQRLERDIPQTIQNRIGRTIRSLGLSLERKIKLEKLSGQVLHRRSGRGVRSVNTVYTEYGSAGSALLGKRFESATGTALKYMRAWVFGFNVPARVITARRKGALYWLGARHPVRSVHQPARHQAPKDWLRPALGEMRPKILVEIGYALRGL